MALSKAASRWVEHFCESRNHRPHSEAWRKEVEASEAVWKALSAAERNAALKALYVP